jgi:hypothetical protein
MGILSNLFGSKPKTSKMRIGGLLASTVEFIIENDGIEVLLGGSLALDKNLRPSFRGGVGPITDELVARVAIKDLPEAEIFLSFAEIKLLDKNILSPCVDKLVYGAMRVFATQSIAFKNLET